MMREHGLPQRREAPVMEVRGLVGRAPEPPRHEPAVPAEQPLRHQALVHVDGLGRGRVGGIGDVVQLEIGEGRHHDPVGRRWRWRQARLGQPRVVEREGERRGLAGAQVGGRVERARLGVAQACARQRQFGDVTPRAAHRAKCPLAESHGLLDIAIVRDHAPRHGQHRLEHRRGRDVGARHLVHHAVAVGIGVAPEPFGRLDAVMMVERRVGELAQ